MLILYFATTLLNAFLRLKSFEVPLKAKSRIATGSMHSTQTYAALTVSTLKRFTCASTFTAAKMNEERKQGTYKIKFYSAVKKN